MAQPWVPQTLPFFSCRIFNLAFFLSPGSRENWRDRWVTEVFVLTDGGTVVLLGREVNMWKCLANEADARLDFKLIFLNMFSYVRLCLAQEISAKTIWIMQPKKHHAKINELRIPSLEFIVADFLSEENELPNWLLWTRDPPQHRSRAPTWNPWLCTQIDLSPAALVLKWIRNSLAQK